MTAITFTQEPSLAELRETEAVYTRAMEYLVADGVKEGEARESVCWQRLNRLHQACFQTVEETAHTLFISGSQAESKGGLAVSALKQK